MDAWERARWLSKIPYGGPVAKEARSCSRCGACGRGDPDPCRGASRGTNPTGGCLAGGDEPDRGLSGRGALAKALSVDLQQDYRENATTKSNGKLNAKPTIRNAAATLEAEANASLERR